MNIHVEVLVKERQHSRHFTTFVLEDKLWVSEYSTIQYAIGMVIEAAFIRNFKGKESVEFLNKIDRIKGLNHRNDAIHEINKIFNEGARFIELVYQARIPEYDFLQNDRILKYIIIINVFRTTKFKVDYDSLREISANHM